MCTAGFDQESYITFEALDGRESRNSDYIALDDGGLIGGGQ
jgi:hypothetical protein